MFITKNSYSGKRARAKFLKKLLVIGEWVGASAIMGMFVGLIYIYLIITH